ncbi:hypothetical protein CGI18_07185 [Vibrio parahaemolyticus]|uniref:hypothetical protein n=1 Tax=Vibrio parahaemolyticus TaxID=670 RepID=UPI00111E74AA|nr:hypothetical protein [Vibrio parahaemolyticus]TOK48268.1 hypothetical protein CGI18_07185 [Vibrio parahaemolyticus]
MTDKYNRQPDGTFGEGNAGRPKGSRNKYTKRMLDTAMKHLEENNNNPIDKLIHLANSTQDEKLAAKIWTDILGYTNHREFIEENDDGTDRVSLDREELLAAIQKELSS